MAFNSNNDLVKQKNNAGLPADLTARPTKAVTSTAFSDTTGPFPSASNSKPYQDQKTHWDNVQRCC